MKQSPTVEEEVRRLGDIVDQVICSWPPMEGGPLSVFYAKHRPQTTMPTMVFDWDFTKMDFQSRRSWKRKHRKRPSKGMRKHIRREKARRRQEAML